MIAIPVKKSDVLRDYHGYGRNRERPALNVKHYGQVEYTAQRIVKEFGCDAETAERAVQFVYESAQEQFWEQARETLNYCWYGESVEKMSRPWPLKVEAEGRSGGWLVADGLPDVTDWGRSECLKWRKFARMMQEEMRYFATWEFGRDMIEANDWAPKAGTTEANAATARATPDSRLAKAARAIHAELNGREWEGADTLDVIADHLRAAGLEICGPDEGED